MWRVFCLPEGKTPDFTSRLKLTGDESLADALKPPNMQLKYKNLTASFLAAAAMVSTGVSPASSAVLPQNAAANTYGPVNTSTPPDAVLAISQSPALRIQETSALDLWLAKLADKESHGEDHIKILDVNGHYSYGCLQFQEWTFKNYGKKYGILKNTADWENQIYDCNLQKQIAKRMIEDDYILWQSWYTSVVIRDLGLPPRS